MTVVEYRAYKMALELVLRSLLNSDKFVNSASVEKDWSVISKLIPGTTPKQCAKKWEEICQKSWFLKPEAKQSDFPRDGNLNAIVNYLLHSKEIEEIGEVTRVRTCHDDEPDDKTTSSSAETHSQDVCSKPVKTEMVDEKKDKDFVVASARKLRPKPISPDGPNMVIHVCDESKNLKQDFLCPRDILVKEMKYFAEYLSLEPQRWEEVDISVHCDVHIFDWLMRYVKCDTTSEDMVPKLEPSNVISILISSDFLRMDSLVTKCIHYCHENLSAIVSTPCNMNCINDKLVRRISKLFNHSELDAIKDRKDKFKSKLFCKKIEEFVEARPVSDFSTDNASTLFRCSSCKKLLTAKNQSKIPCVLNRLNVDSRGQMSYGHTRDSSWDINDHLLSLKEKLRSWRDVYWRLWGSTVSLFCYHCRCYFPCTELGHCRYHTCTAEFPTVKDDHNSAIVGIYPCCQQKALRYDSVGVFTGCHVKDHFLTPSKSSSAVGSKRAGDKVEVDKSTKDEGDTSSPDSETADQDKTDKSESVDSGVNNPVIIKELLAHRNVICTPFQRLASARTSELNVFHDDESTGSWRSPGVVSQKSSASGASNERRALIDSTTALPPIRRSKTSISQRMPSGRRKTAILKNTYCNSTEDEEDDDDSYQAMKDRHFPRLKKKPLLEGRQSSSGFKWDPQRSPRWNQDAQREEDSKRITEVINAMAKLRSTANQEKKPKAKEFQGGIFHKLEHQFRVSTQPLVVKHQPSNGQLISGSRAKRSVVKSKD